MFFANNYMLKKKGHAGPRATLKSVTEWYYDLFNLRMTYLICG